MSKLNVKNLKYVPFEMGDKEYKLRLGIGAIRELKNKDIDILQVASTAEQDPLSMIAIMPDLLASALSVFHKDLANADDSELLIEMATDEDKLDELFEAIVKSADFLMKAGQNKGVPAPKEVKQSKNK